MYLQIELSNLVVLSRNKIYDIHLRTVSILFFEVLLGAITIWLDMSSDSLVTGWSKAAIHIIAWLLVNEKYGGLICWRTLISWSRISGEVGVLGRIEGLLSRSFAWLLARSWNSLSQSARPDYRPIKHPRQPIAVGIRHDHMKGCDNPRWFVSTLIWDSLVGAK